MLMLALGRGRWAVSQKCIMMYLEQKLSTVISWGRARGAGLKLIHIEIIFQILLLKFGYLVFLFVLSWFSLLLIKFFVLTSVVP